LGLEKLREGGVLVVADSRGRDASEKRGEQAQPMTFFESFSEVLQEQFFGPAAEEERADMIRKRRPSYLGLKIV